MRWCGFSKSQKSLLSSPSKSFERIRSGPGSFLFTSMTLLPLCFLSTVALFMLTTNHLVLLLFDFCFGGGYTRSFDSIGALASSSQSGKCETSFFSVDFHQANLLPQLLLFNSPFASILFLELPLTTLFPFLNMYTR